MLGFGFGFGFANCAIFADSYVNIEFPCHSGTTVEIIPRVIPGIPDESPYDGEVRIPFVDNNAEDASGFLEFRLATVSFESQDNLFLVVTMNNIVNGSIVVGTTLFQNLVVSHIVQFGTCEQ